MTVGASSSRFQLSGPDPDLGIKTGVLCGVEVSERLQWLFTKEPKMSARRGGIWAETHFANYAFDLLRIQDDCRAAIEGLEKQDEMEKAELIIRQGQRRRQEKEKWAAALERHMGYMNNLHKTS